MSLRPIKQIIQPKPTIEGAGVKLQRASVSAKRRILIPFCCWMISAMTIRQTTGRDFPGIRTAGSRRSRTCLRAQSNTATTWATKEK